jgi:hypothetical protein
VYVHRYLTSDHSTMANGKSAAQGAIILRTSSIPPASSDTEHATVNDIMPGTVDDMLPETGVDLTGRDMVLETAS